MSEHKAFASLSSGLLARKGSARPAMRRQGFGQVGPGGLDDLGWNDLGDPDYPEQDNEQAMIRMAQADQLEPLDTPEGEVVDAFKRNPISMLSPYTSPVHDQREELERAFGYDEDEEHHDGDDIYDETAEPWDEEEAGPAVAIEIPTDRGAPSFDEEPKLRRTVADLIPPVDAGATSPLSDFSHLPTDFSGFTKKPALPTPSYEDEPVAEAPAAPEGFTPFAGEPAAFEEETEELVAFDPTFGEADEEDEVEGIVDPLAGFRAYEAEEARAPEADEPEAVVEAETEAVFEAEAEPEAEIEEAPVAATVIDPVWAQFAEHDAPVEDVADAAEPEAEAVEPEPVAEIAPEPVAYEPEPVAFEVPEHSVFEPSEAPVVEIETAAAPADDYAIAAQLVDAIEPAPARTVDGKGKAAFTLRLDAERHLKLRLACAMSGQSAQKFVTEALDAYLAAIPNLDELANRSPK